MSFNLISRSTRLLNLESDLSRTQSDKRALEQTISELRERIATEDAKWTQRMSEERGRSETLQYDALESARKLVALSAELDEMKTRCERAERDAKSLSTTAVDETQINMRISTAVRDAENNLIAAHEKTRKEEKDAADRIKLDLESQITTLSATVSSLSDELIKASSVTASTTSSSAIVSQDQMKEIVQGIYGKLHERLVPSDEDDGVSYTPAEVMQHVRAVMKLVVAEHSTK